ncbi:MAG: hypothetical protein H6822_19945 [Planctomycetaceae bacterium]|nr:hypothetical protein [Planctomycetales bacterium]MCB9924461.1 hypothetical protein [Planctomycetaceae bacterium]
MHLRQLSCCLVLLLVGFAVNALAQITRGESPQAEFPRPTLQIINGSGDPIDLFWINDQGERVSNGRVPPGKDAIITTTIGHRFAIVGKDAEQVVNSKVPIQAHRFDPEGTDGVPAFYAQRTDAGGFPIVASATVNPYALKEAKYLVDMMLAKRPDVRKAMVDSGARLCILAYNEFTTDQPEWARFREAEPPPKFKGLSGRDYWDRRARGMGGSQTDPYCSCAEENLLAYPGDMYSTENILIHELAHNIHLRGMTNVDPTFDRRLEDTYKAAMAKGLWKDKYASTNHHEYFAEGVQSWFDNNREPDHDHNHVNTREELLEYDPGLAAMCREVFGDTELRYAKPQTRLHGHLAGYDPSNAPTFRWPPRLVEADKRITPRKTPEGFPTGYFYMTNKFVEGQNLVLESAPLTLRERGNFSGMQWKTLPAGDGYFFLTSQFLEERNQVLEGGNGEAAAFMASNNGVTGTRWKAVPADDGYYFLTTMYMEESKKVLEGNVGDAKADRSDPFKGGPHMVARRATGTMWKFIPVE